MISAAGEIGVVVESVSADVRVVGVKEGVLDLPVGRTLSDGEFEIFLSDGVPELCTN